jgi:hypothetical protein
MRKSNRVGKAGEELGYIQIAIQEGFAAKIRRTGVGHDYKSEKYNFYTGEWEETYHEIKAGKHPQLSERQKEAQRKLGDKYRVHRVNLPFNPDLY